MKVISLSVLVLALAGYAFAQAGLDEGLFVGSAAQPVEEAPPPPPDAEDPFLAELKAAAATQDLEAAESEIAPADDALEIQPAVLRDPFWPVGYEPPKPRRAEDVAETSQVAVVQSAVPLWAEALKTVGVQGVMKTGADTYVAMVNGAVSAVGDTVSLTYQGRAYQWRIAAISERGVSFVRVEPQP